MAQKSYQKTKTEPDATMEELKALIREGHETIKDLNDSRRRAEEFAVELRKGLDLIDSEIVGAIAKKMEHNALRAGEAHNEIIKKVIAEESKRLKQYFRAVMENALRDAMVKTTTRGAAFVLIDVEDPEKS